MKGISFKVIAIFSILVLSRASRQSDSNRESDSENVSESKANSEANADSEPNTDSEPKITRNSESQADAESTIDSDADIDAFNEDDYNENENESKSSGEGRTSFYISQVRLSMQGLIRGFYTEEVYLLNPGHDVVCSPLSAVLLLGKIGFGASGTCQEQIYKAVGVYDDYMAMQDLKSLAQQLNTINSVQLTIANKIFVSDKLELKRKFVEITKEVFGSTVMKTDMEDKKNLAANINTWVSQHTQKRIPKLFEPNDFSQSTVLVMVNAIYFKAKWEHPFKPNSKIESFNSPRGVVRVPMMKQLSFMDYTTSNDLDAQIVNLRYQGGQAGLIVIVPSSKTDITRLVKKLHVNPDLLNNALEHLERHYIDLSMPKFTIESKIDLKKVYEKLGVTQMFERKNPGLTEIADDQDLRVSMAIQKAIIIVDEKGTEAAAVSAVGIMTLSLKPKPIKVNVTRPFYYILHAFGEQLFRGVCTF